MTLIVHSSPRRTHSDLCRLHLLRLKYRLFMSVLVAASLADKLH